MKQSVNSLSLLISLTLFIIVLHSTSALATEYYIDQEIEIMENGDAVVSGIVNVDLFSDISIKGDTIQGTTSELTSKSGAQWIFSYQNNEVFSNYIVKILFPSGVKISNIVSESELSIENENSRTKLVFIGKDQVLDINVEYSFDTKLETNYNAVSYGLFIFIIVLCLFIYFNKKHHKKQHQQKKQTDKHDKKENSTEKQLNKTKLNTIKLTLNETQLKIVDALLDQDGECSQTKLRHLTGIPKASLSRNLELLSQKHVVSKFYNGTSNYIKVHVGLYEK